MKKQLFCMKSREQFAWKTPSVFYLCNQFETPEFLEIGQALLLENLSCTLYYDPAPNTPWEMDDLEEQLSQMDMFLMPINKMFLTEQIRSLLFFIDFAKKHSIRILPILTEEGLVDLFNEKCGAIQCFSLSEFHRGDDEAFRRLQNFLTFAFLNSDIRDRVGDVFQDKNIFISYRKKDALYLKKLETELRNDPYFQGVKIWYDDYLVTGEDYVEAIREKIDECSIVLLLVTPSIYEPAENGEMNYVQAKEYPQAIASRKMVLPVLMDERTDLDTFWEAYPEMESLWDGNRIDELLAEIKDVFEEKSSENESREDLLEKRYYQGVAYQQGIDCPQDLALGARIIEEVAKEGHFNANVHMSICYMNGVSVEQDLDKAYEYWLRGRQISDLPEATNDSELALQLIQYAEFMKHNSGKELLNEVMTIYESIIALANQREKFPLEMACYVSYAYTEIGADALLREDITRAEEQIRCSRMLCKEMYEDLENIPDAYARLMLETFTRDYYYMADCYRAHHQVDGIQKSYIYALQKGTELYGRFPGKETLTLLSEVMKETMVCIQEYASTYREEARELCQATINTFPELLDT